MLCPCQHLPEYWVALLTEGVDRNAHILFARHLAAVALLTEGVDRNALFTSSCASSTVALLTEGVDRNLTSSLRH